MHIIGMSHIKGTWLTSSSTISNYTVKFIQTEDVGRFTWVGISSATEDPNNCLRISGFAEFPK